MNSRGKYNCAGTPFARSVAGYKINQAEQATLNRQVAGSIPAWPTITGHLTCNATSPQSRNGRRSALTVVRPGPSSGFSLPGINLRDVRLSHSTPVVIAPRARPSPAIERTLRLEASRSNSLNDGEGYVPSKGFSNSTPRSSKSLTFRVTTVSRCTMAVAAIMASSIIVSDLLCVSRALSRKAGASICNTP